MINWKNIKTLFLDMDGTLLDLNFDNHFWRQLVPQRYAREKNLDPGQAKAALFKKYKQIEGTMDWYCLDYWSRELGMDIPLLKQEVDHLIRVHPFVLEFLEKIKTLDTRIVLVTNAHGKSIELKMNKTQLHHHFDALICAHDIGMPKENRSFWTELQKVEKFDPGCTLLIDDSLAVLESAKDYGIRYLLAVYKPDTNNPPVDVRGFDAIHSFSEIMP